MKNLVFAVVLGLCQMAAQGVYVAPVEHVLDHDYDDFGMPLSDFGAVNVGEDRIFIFGGCFAAVQNATCQDISDKAFYYHPLAKRNTTLGSPPSGLKRFRHAIAFNAENGKVYITGGLNIDDLVPAIDVIDVFNTKTNQWEPSLTAKFPSPTRSDHVGFGIDDKVYFAGGYDPSTYADDVSLHTIISIDLDGNVAVVKDKNGANLSIGSSRGDGKAAILDEKAYIIGGYTDLVNWGESNTMVAFDPLELTVEEHPLQLRVPRGDVGFASYRNRLYVFGGQVFEGASNVDSTIEIYDPVHDRWIHGGELAEERFRFEAVGTDDGIYLIGGQTNPDFAQSTFDILKKISLYQEVTGLYDMPTITVHGSGTTNPSVFFWHTMDIMTVQTRLPVKMSYRAIGSGDGQKEFMGNADSAFLPVTQFGSGDIPFSKADYDSLKVDGHEFAQLPFALGAIGIYVHIPEMKGTNNRLVLSACDLAGIYQRKITNWKDLASKHSDNAWIANIDKNILPAVRKGKSSSTSGITNFLAKACSSWPSDLKGGEIVWPCFVKGECDKGEGSGGIQSYIEETPYSIGYLSVGHGDESKLSPAHLINKKGEPEVPSAASIQAAASGFTNWPTNSAFEDFSNVDLVNSPGENAWPIVLVSYIYVRKDLTHYGSSAALLKAFLEYVLDEERGQQTMQDFQFVPMVAKPLALAKDAVNALILPDVPMFIVEKDTQAVVGAGPFVLSSKRESFQTHHIPTDEDLDVIRENIKQQQSSITTQQTQLKSLQTQQDQLEILQNEITDSSNARSIAIAAIVIGVLNLIVLVALFLYMSFLGKLVRQAKNTRTDHARGIEMNNGNREHSDLDSNSSFAPVQQSTHVTGV